MDSNRSSRVQRCHIVDSTRGGLESVDHSQELHICNENESVIIAVITYYSCNSVITRYRCHNYTCTGASAICYAATCTAKASMPFPLIPSIMM